MPVERKSIQLRITPELASEIGKAAEAEGRSVNNWIERTLTYLLMVRSPSTLEKAFDRVGQSSERMANAPIGFEDSVDRIGKAAERMMNAPLPALPTGEVLRAKQKAAKSEHRPPPDPPHAPTRMPNSNDWPTPTAKVRPVKSERDVNPILKKGKKP